MQSEKNERIIEHLMDKWGNNSCPMCNENRWSVQDTVYELREYHGGGLVIGSGPILPITPVTCENCGNTIFVNALKAGLVNGPDQPLEESDLEEESNAE